MPRKSTVRMPVNYRLAVDGWQAMFSACTRTGDPPDELEPESLSIGLRVRLQSPVKGVEAGELVVYSCADSAMGMLNYNVEKVLQGAVWVSCDAVRSLLVLLCSGRDIELDLLGNPFRYRKALVTHICWCTAGHSDLEW